MIMLVFKKDVRRLWKEIAVTVLLLAWLTWLDRWRSDWTPGAAEGWLNLLLPLAWAVLIALLVHEDPLVGDRQFWVTMPIRARSLFAAKALFILAVIHAPDFAADAAILWGRGFRPYLYLPQLAWKQFLLLIALTLPAIALATLVRNTAQFMVAAIVLAAAAAISVGGIGFDNVPIWDPLALDVVRFGIALIPIVAASLAVMALQYARRRAAVSRWIGIAAVAGSALLYALVPVASTAAMRCAISPHTSSAGSLAVLFDPDASLPPPYRSYGSSRDVRLPIRISGPGEVTTRFDQVALEIETRDRTRYQTARSSTIQDFPIQAFLMLEAPSGIRFNGGRGGAPNRLLLRISPKVYDAIRNGPVKIRGQLLAEFFREYDRKTIPTSATAAVPGFGICSSTTVQRRLDEPLLKVVCESVDQIPSFIRVRLIDSASRRDWTAFLGDSWGSVAHPRTTWLSPLNRRVTFFHLTPAADEASNWAVPLEVIPDATVEIAPERPAGSTVVGYELTDIVLSKFAADAVR